MSSATARGRGGYPSLALRYGLDSGVHRLLETPLSINGAEGSTVLRFLGSQAAAAGWPEYGGAGTLALQAGTAPTYGVQSPYLGALDAGVMFNGGGYYKLAGLGNVTTDSYIIEAVIGPRTPAAEAAIAGTFLTRGWLLYWANAGAVQIYSQGPGGGGGPTITMPSVGVSIVHAFYRAGGSCILYANGTASGAADVSAYGSLTSAAEFFVGNRASATKPYSGEILLLQIWPAATLNSHLQAAAHAARMALLSSARPLISIAASTGPTAQGSTSPAYQERIVAGVSRLHYMGAGAPRFCQRTAADGRVFTGACVETGDQSKCLQSDALGTTWTAVALTSITANGQTASDGNATLDGLVDTAATTAHGVTQAITLTAVEWCISAEFKAGNKSWCYLVDETIANGGAYYDIANGAWGTVGAGVKDKWLLYTATGTVRGIGIKVDGTAAAHTIGLYAASANGGQSFAGDATTVNLWAGKVQVTINDYPSSRVNTTTAAVTRAADSPLRYAGAAHFGSGQGSLFLRFLSPTFAPGRNHYLATAYLAGSAATEYITIALESATGHLLVTSASAGLSAGSIELATNFCDNAIHTLALAWSANNLRAWVDGVMSSVDSDVGIPPALDTLDIGADVAAANQAGPVLIDGVQLLPTAVLSPIPPPSGYLW